MITKFSLIPFDLIPFDYSGLREPASSLVDEVILQQKEDRTVWTSAQHEMFKAGKVGAMGAEAKNLMLGVLAYGQLAFLHTSLGWCLKEDVLDEMRSRLNIYVPVFALRTEALHAQILGFGFQLEEPQLDLLACWPVEVESLLPWYARACKIGF